MAENDVESVENMAAAIEWCRINRPDFVPTIRQLIHTESGACLVGIAFDAGRCFQHANPECPLGPIMPGGDWKPITNAVYESRGESPPEQP